MPRLMRRTSSMLAMGVALLCISGCRDILSWSPDGKTFAYLASDESLWIWNADTREGKKVADDVVFCRYSPSGHLLFGQRIGEVQFSVFASRPKSMSSSECWLQSIAPEDSGTEIVSDGAPSMGTSGDGKFWYYARQDEDESVQQSALWEYDWKENKKERLFVTPNELFQTSGNASGTAVLYVAMMQDNDETCVLSVYDKVAKTHKELDKAAKRIFWWPTWLDESHVLAIPGGNGEGDDPFGDLTLYNLGDGSKRIVKKDVVAYYQPISLSPDRKRALVAIFRPGIPQDWASALQVASVDIETGSTTTLTEEAFGASFAQFRPAGNAIAFLGTADIDHEMSAPAILDLDTKSRSLVWRTEDERQFSMAEAMLDAGRRPEALSMFEELCKREPEYDLASRAWYRVAESLLSEDAPDYEKVYAACSSASHAEQLKPLIWNNAQPSAIDPSGDCIRTYCTDKAREQFQYETDHTRDLRGVQVRWSPNRLFVKIDFNSSYDLYGAALADTILLFDYDSPENGARAITPLTDWDHGAERIVYFRHWNTGNESGHYDIQVLNEAGETRSQILGSGFDGAEFPPVTIAETITNPDGGGSLVLSLSREVMRFPQYTEIFIQVSTTQGGVAERLELERPRERPGSGKPECDIADAFGEENTRERIDADLKANEANAEYRAVIRGYAVSTRAPEP